MKRILGLFTCLLLIFSCYTRAVSASEDGEILGSKQIYIVYTIRASIVLKVDDIEYAYKLEVGDKIKEPSHPEKPGYNFDGWFDENGNKWDFNNPIRENLQLFARYSKVIDNEDKPVVLEIEEKTGLYEGEFLAYLKSFGLEGEKVGEEYSEKYSRGRIIRHDFGNLEKGDKIGYVVSLGSKNQQDVPVFVSPATGIE